ncbi:hypothetical protein [Peptostreptococcus sp. D1]|uniref:hypothetical protein n=1 Tax=Peptostreptococcus sp. D1 TaxID=72304 RepID=UPI001A9A4B61|nr:hypothetical protein [Peptostreptococcus sp. D1]
MKITLMVAEDIFFNGQIYDAFSFIVGFIQKAKKEMILINDKIRRKKEFWNCKDRRQGLDSRSGK